MRFYIKLSLFVLVFLGMQKGLVVHEERVRQAVFTIRCGFAVQARDQQMIDQLVGEAQRASRRQSNAMFLGIR